MVRRKVFEEGLKEKTVCHEVVDGGRATFQHLSATFLLLKRDRTLTTVSVERGRGIVSSGYSVSKSMVSTRMR